MKTKRTLGEISYEVEWCVDCPTDEYGDAMLDEAKYRRVFLPTREAAVDKASELLKAKLDYFDCISVTKCEWIDPYGESIPATYRWEYVDDPEHFSASDFEAVTNELD